MTARVSPAPLRGEAKAIASKSDAHRCLIAAALADGPTTLRIDGGSEDIDATVSALKSLGTVIERGEGFLRVVPSPPATNPLIDCVESGSTLRFLLPVAAALCTSSCFTGRGRLPDRPIGELIACLGEGGVSFDGERLPFSVSGGLMPGTYSLPGHVSSQYISGLLFALPLLKGDSRVILTSPLQSGGYVDMTIDAMRRFGVAVEREPNAFTVAGGQRYRTSGTVVIEGDWSNAAFFLCAGAVGGDVTLIGLRIDSLQRDREIIDCLRRFGASVQSDCERVRVRAATLEATEIDVSDIPDLLPVLAVVAGAAKGITRFTNAARLRLKESDRLDSTLAMLGAMGAGAEVIADTFIVHGGRYRGGSVYSRGDHRIAMAAAVAASRADGETLIHGAEACRKSYPGFFRDFEALGGICNVIDDR